METSEIVNEIDENGLFRSKELGYKFTSNLIEKILSDNLDSDIDEIEDWVSTLTYKDLYLMKRILDNMELISKPSFDKGCSEEEIIEKVEQFKDIVSLTQCLYRFENGSMNKFNEDIGNDYILKLSQSCYLEIGKRRGKIDPSVRLIDISEN